MRIINPPTVEPITLIEARKQCKVDAEGTPLAHEDDSLILIFISAAREWAEAYMGRTVAPTGVEISFKAFPAADIVLESGPVLGVPVVAYTNLLGVEVILSPLVYALNDTKPISVLRLNIGQVWPVAIAEADAVRVRYTIGFSDDTASPKAMPASVKTAILLVLGHLYRNRENSVEKALSTIPLGAASFLDPFRLRRGFA